MVHQRTGRGRGSSSSAPRLARWFGVAFAGPVPSAASAHRPSPETGTARDRPVTTARGRVQERGPGGNLHNTDSHPVNLRIIGPTRGTTVPAQQGTGASTDAAGPLARWTSTDAPGRGAGDRPGGLRKAPTTAAANGRSHPRQRLRGAGVDPGGRCCCEGADAGPRGRPDTWAMTPGRLRG